MVPPSLRATLLAATASLIAASAAAEGVQDRARSAFDDLEAEEGKAPASPSKEGRSAAPDIRGAPVRELPPPRPDAAPQSGSAPSPGAPQPQAAAPLERAQTVVDMNGMVAKLTFEKLGEGRAGYAMQTLVAKDRYDALLIQRGWLAPAYREAILNAIRRRKGNPGLAGGIADSVQATAAHLHVLTEARKNPGNLPPWAVAEVGASLNALKTMAGMQNRNNADPAAPNGLILLEKPKDPAPAR